MSCFIFRIDEDVDLNYHYDNAEVTLNVSLGGDYEEGSLYFGGMRTDVNRDDWMTESTHKVCHILYTGGSLIHVLFFSLLAQLAVLLSWRVSTLKQASFCKSHASDLK